MKRVSFVGQLASDPETRTRQSHPMASFRLALARPCRRSGEAAEGVFVEVVSFDALARNVGEHLGRGHLVAVTGRLEPREWIAEDGSPRSRLQVVADQVTCLTEGLEEEVACLNEGQEDEGGRESRGDKQAGGRSCESR